MEISQLGINIKKFREELGWDKNELKRISGVGYATIYDIECGKTQFLKSTNLEKIATALSKSVDDLLGFEVDVIEHEVSDLSEVFKVILQSDDLSLDDIFLNSYEKESLNNIFEFAINSLRRERLKSNE